MRRLIAWLGAAFGGVALYRLLARRRDSRPGPETEREAPGADRRAEELRRKLEESRALVDERDAFEDGETTLDRADPEAAPDERRREVHERGRAAADEMRSPGRRDS
jgi:hypothetical protein